MEGNYDSGIPELYERVHRAEERAERAEAECERLRDALRFYARHEHWMEITERSESRIVLVACGSTGNPNGWSEAEQALATVPTKTECWRCNGKGEDPNCPVCDAENFDSPPTPEQTGDALAAFDRLWACLRVRSVNMKRDAETVRQALTASGVPSVCPDCRDGSGSEVTGWYYQCDQCGRHWKEVEQDSGVPEEAALNQAYLSVAGLAASAMGVAPMSPAEASKHASYIRDALDASGVPYVPENAPAAFVDWLVHEMPPGTTIGDPGWWAPRIWRRVRYALASAPADGGNSGE